MRAGGGSARCCGYAGGGSVGKYCAAANLPMIDSMRSSWDICR